MRVGFFTRMPRLFYSGGAEVQVEKTLEWLRRQGVEAGYVEYGTRGMRPDLFHFFGICPSELVMVAATQAPVVVSTIYDNWDRLEISKIKALRRVPFTVFRSNWRALCRAGCLMPNSQAEKCQLLDHWGVDENKVRVVPNGVDEDFVGKNPKQFWNKFLPGHNPEKRFVLSAHRIERRKNTLILVQAAIKTGNFLILAGQVNPVAGEQAYVREVMDLIESSSGLVRYVGPLSREDLREGYAAAHVHALPSVYETTGLSSLEAGLNGANLVVGDCPPVREYFDGLADFSDGSLDGLCSALETAMNRPRNAMRQDRQIRDRYSWRRVAEETYRCYEFALGCAGA
jgi:glycosyltransferase involved in cell wall biosynthesis